MAHTSRTKGNRELTKRVTSLGGEFKLGLSKSIDLVIIEKPNLAKITQGFTNWRDNLMRKYLN